LSTPQIAIKLHISPTTVRTHLKHLYAKLSVKNRVLLALHVNSGNL
jgi:DNA-binding CsgD family transcriptional regulator